MVYTGQYKDINDTIYTVTITTPKTGDNQNLVFGSSPVEITTSSQGLFTPIKSREASIQITTKAYHFDLYTPKSREVLVEIYQGEEKIFKGFLVPSAYNQDYTYLDTITLNAVDAVSTSKDFSFTGIWSDLTAYLLATDTSEEIVNGGSSSTVIPDWETMYGQFMDDTNNILYGIDSSRLSDLQLYYISFYELIILILRSCGYTGEIYFPNVYEKVNGDSISDLNIHNVVEGLYAASSNFFDDDAVHTPWNQYDVLSELMKFLGWSLVPDGEDIWCIDYRSLNSQEDISYSKYNISDSTYVEEVTIPYSSIDISDIESSGTPSLSLEDIYNKIEISANLYEIGDLAADIFDDNAHISVTEEIDLDENEHQWSITEVKKFLWWVTASHETITGYTYQTMCRLSPTTKFTHHFFKHSSLSDIEINNDSNEQWKGKNYYDINSTSQYTGDDINKYCNTHGCLAQHYAYRPEEGKNNLPTTLDWTDILTFFVTDDTTPNMTMSQLPLLEKPVLEYDVNEEINFKPASGTSWITIQGDLFYQYNGVDYKAGGKKDKDNQVLTIINDTEKYYCTCPVDKSCPEIKDKKYCSFYRDYNTFKNTVYGLGFGLWKMRVNIGDKYWYDYYDSTQNKYLSGWTTTPTDFYIRYNNNPADKADEFLSCFEWMGIASNTDFKSKCGVDGYCIPIRSDDPDAPTFGKLHITIYTPALLPAEIRDWWTSHYGSNTVTWDQLPPVIYAKNFDIGYVYTDESVWYKQHKSDYSRDRVYTGVIDNGNVKTFDTLEFKLNTMLKNQPISRSYVTTENGYLSSLEHKYGTLYQKDGSVYKEKTQEYNILDQYLDHHSERRPIYTANVHGYQKPYSIFNYGRFLINESTTYPFDLVIDTQSFNTLYNKNSIKFIAY